MPRAKTHLTPAEYAVLGLVRRGPTYGYELQRQLSGNTGLALVCPVEPAMIYAILKSLSGLELIDGQWDNSTYPPKAVHRATDAGEIAFVRWLQKPVGRIREVRLDLLVKLFFLLDEDRPAATLLIEEQIDVCRSYSFEVESAFEEREPGSFDAIALGGKLSAVRLTIAWLEETLQGLAEAAPTPEPQPTQGINK